MPSLPHLKPLHCSTTLAFTLALLLSASAAHAANAPAELSLKEKAEKAASDLPLGCIVTATQKGDEAPVFSLAGKHDPKSVPPEKTVFEIGSISKVFTALLLAQAVLEKKLTLDSTLREVMGPRQSFADENVAAITLRQLATHTSGLPRLPEDIFAGAELLDPYAHYDRKHLDAYMAKAKLAHAPPFPTAYSNLGTGLLGDLLARLYGQDWEKLAVDRIAKPLGMKDTCVTLTTEQSRRLAPPNMKNLRVKQWHFQALAGAGALYSTASDLLRFAAALDQPGNTPLKEAIEMVEQPQGDDNFGLCLLVCLQKGKTHYWYQGGTGGYGSWVSADPATHEKKVILINNNSMMPQEVLFGSPPQKKKRP